MTSFLVRMALSASLPLLVIAGGGRAEAATFTVTSAHVVLTEGTYSPASVLFTADVAAGACAPGVGLTFTPQGTNDAQKTASASAVFATLLSAKLTGTTIIFGGNDTGCVVSFVQSH